jgi:hypothetical protein
MNSQSLLITWERQPEQFLIPGSELNDYQQINIFSSDFQVNLLSEKKHLQIFLPPDLSQSYQKSLMHFFEAKFETQGLTDLYIHLENPLFQIFLDLSTKANWKLWVEGRGLLKNWPKLPDNPEHVYWLCHSFELAETLMIMGISALHLFNPDCKEIPTIPIYPLKHKLSEYLLPFQTTPYGMNGEEGLFCLIHRAHDQAMGGKLISSFIETFAASETVKLVILPRFRAALDVASQIYDSLLNWFESEGIESEEVPEIIVLEPHIADYWPVFSSAPIFFVESHSSDDIQIALQVLREGGWVVSLSEEFTQKLAQFQEPIASMPPDFPLSLAPWLNQFEEIHIFKPDPRAFYLWNQTLLEQAALKKG